MALAITVDTVPGSNEDVAINALRQLALTGILGSPTTYLWTLLDKPPGSATTISNTAISNPTITPDSEGGYHIRAEVTGSGGYQRNEIHLVVRQLKTRDKVLAAGYNAKDPYQTVGDTVDGWAPPLHVTQRRVDSMYAAEYGVVVGVAGAAGLLPGNVVRISGATTIKSGLPGAEDVPTWVLAQASTQSHASSMLGVVIEGVDGSGTPANGALIRVRVAGRMTMNTTGSAVGNPVYLSDAGALSLSVGTWRRVVGTVHTVGNPGQIWINGWQPSTSSSIDLSAIRLGGGAPLSNNTGFLQTDGVIVVQGSLGLRVSGVLEMTGSVSEAFVAGAGSGTRLTLFSQLSAGSTDTGVRVNGPNDRSAGYLFDVGDTISAAFSRKFGVQHDGKTEIVGTGSSDRLHLHSPGGSDPTIIRLTVSASGTTGTDGTALSVDPSSNAYLWNYESAAIHFGTVNTGRWSIDSAGNLVNYTDASVSLGDATHRVLRLFLKEYWEGDEIADPAAPAANKGRLYFKDNGAGKTQLVVRFPTGAVQVIATEP